MDAYEKINVLLVDDQPAKLLSYEVMLGELNENLIKVSSANEALEILLKTEVAVILIDVCMPGLDGFELATMIRDHPRFQNTAIIFVSAVHLSEMDHLRGYSAGAVDYVAVPVVPEVLRAKVKVFAELFRKTKQLELLNRELERRVAERTAALQDSTAKLLESERARGLALAAGNMGAWEYHFAEERWQWDEGHSRIFGNEASERFCDTKSFMRFFSQGDWDALRAALRGVDAEHSTFQKEIRILRPDGEERVCLVSAASSFDDKGRIARIDGVTLDITDRKEAENRQALLAKEVDHRARNMLAVVQSIVRLTKSNNVGEYVKSIDGRIRALAHAHELLSQSRWRGAEIARLIGEEIAPYRAGNRAQITMAGPSIVLAPAKAQAVALALHELATNAAKYGALSSDGGTVTIDWKIENGLLGLCWRESGGPAVSTPSKGGFGTQIITASIKGQCRGTVGFDWHAEGLCCNFTVLCSDGELDLPASPAPVSADAAQSQILIAEDEALCGLFLQDIIAELGLAVSGPYNSMAAAMAAARGDNLSAAVLDVNLNGEAVYPLAEILDERGIPFIFVTGYDKERIASRFDHIPALQKPLMREHLEQALSGMLDRSKRRLLHNA